MGRLATIAIVGVTAAALVVVVVAAWPVYVVGCVATVLVRRREYS